MMETESDRFLKLTIFREVLNTDFAAFTNHENTLRGNTVRAGLFNQGVSLAKLRVLKDKLGNVPSNWNVDVEKVEVLDGGSI